MSINFYQQVKFSRPLTLEDFGSPVLLTVFHQLIHWTKKWICSNLPMSKDVANMIANLKQMWWRPYLLTFVSKYGLHHVYPLVNIIFDTYLLICKDEQIHFFMQWLVRLGVRRRPIKMYLESEYQVFICHIRLTCSRPKIYFDGGFYPWKGCFVITHVHSQNYIGW